jgi:hypothetical protein
MGETTEHNISEIQLVSNVIAGKVCLQKGP